MVHFPLATVRRVLCLGSHSDDIEIGCGATLLTMVERCRPLEIMWVVFSGGGPRTREARASAQQFVRGATRTTIVVKNFRASYFPYDAERIKRYFETLKGFKPDLVLTHARHDRHQDHRVLSDLAWNTFRDHLILEYEIPKYDGDLGAPNLFVPVDEGVARAKAQRICSVFQTQGNKHWFSEDTFLALMRLRGMECAAQTKYAEAFYCRKIALG